MDTPTAQTPRADENHQKARALIEKARQSAHHIGLSDPGLVNEYVINYLALEAVDPLITQEQHR